VTDEQQVEMAERLARIEAKLDNGVNKTLDAIQKWIGTHPRVCPLELRKNQFVVPVVVALATAVAMRLMDALPSIIGSLPKVIP
jgi:hypothetical protein